MSHVRYVFLIDFIYLRKKRKEITSCISETNYIPRLMTWHKRALEKNTSLLVVFKGRLMLVRVMKQNQAAALVIRVSQSKLILIDYLTAEPKKQLIPIRNFITCPIKDQWTVNIFLTSQFLDNETHVSNHQRVYSRNQSKPHHILMNTTKERHRDVFRCPEYYECKRSLYCGNMWQHLAFTHTLLVYAKNILLSRKVYPLRLVSSMKIIIIMEMKQTEN